MENDADLVLVFGGTNDYGHGNALFGTMEGRAPETFCGACHLLFRGLAEKYPLAKIVVMTPMQREGGSQPSAFRPEGRPLLDYVDAITEIAGSYSLPVLDVYRTAGICSDISVQKERFCPDGLHSNDTGARA
ncbi:MAG: SGNH/GDSL hydrolase family protein [Clostridiales bacterium]|nr:SGNH/GDSL hydrolase family protein [Clostridiales bacterium]